MSLSPDQKLAAYLLGRRIAGQRRKQDRVPVAYLYNGVRFPIIPEEITTNAYVYILESVESKQYVAYGFDTKPTTVVVTNIFGSTEKLRVDSGTYASANWYSSQPDNWIGIETDKNPADAALGYVESNLSGILWANFDVYTSEGALFLAASDPIPVYE